MVVAVIGAPSCCDVIARRMAVCDPEKPPMRDEDVFRFPVAERVGVGLVIAGRRDLVRDGQAHEADLDAMPDLPCLAAVGDHAALRDGRMSNSPVLLSWTRKAR